MRRSPGSEATVQAAWRPSSTSGQSARTTFQGRRLTHGASLTATTRQPPSFRTARPAHALARRAHPDAPHTLLLPTPQGKTSRAGLLTHFHAVLNEGPAILYNVPGRTGQDVTPDVMAQLAEHPAFLGVKECAGNARVAAHAARGVNCWCALASCGRAHDHSQMAFGQEQFRRHSIHSRVEVCGGMRSPGTCCRESSTEAWWGSWWGLCSARQSAARPLP